MMLMVMSVEVLRQAICKDHVSLYMAPVGQGLSPCIPNIWRLNWGTYPGYSWVKQLCHAVWPEGLGLVKDP